MTHVGIDLTQFVTDPYTSGIQRVLQYLAREWPIDQIPCDFVVPVGDEFLLLGAEQAAGLIDSAFGAQGADEVRRAVGLGVAALAEESPRVRQSGLLAMYSSWLLPEVSYLPNVLDRLELFRQTMPVAMIGYDALPMTDPANYRFTPGTAAQVSEYFRMLAAADAVVCISEFSRDAILRRLRRAASARTEVAHPGGDHLSVAHKEVADGSSDRPVRFLRVGTLEARKRPVEIIRAFQQARQEGINAELQFVGAPSASDRGINAALSQACQQDSNMSWIQAASDEVVHRAFLDSDVFLSFGIEGYGIPVLESIRRATPVLYGGVQPAGDLMQGSGSRNAGGDSHELLVAMFHRFAVFSEAQALNSEVAPQAVPRWRDFTHAVARASVG